MSKKKEGRRGGKKKEGVGQGRDNCSERESEREGERERSVHMTGIHASKRRRKKWFVWTERRTSVISLWEVNSWFVVLHGSGYLFAILPAKNNALTVFKNLFTSHLWFTLTSPGQTGADIHVERRESELGTKE